MLHLQHGRPFLLILSNTKSYHQLMLLFNLPYSVNPVALMFTSTFLLKSKHP